MGEYTQPATCPTRYQSCNSPATIPKSGHFTNSFPDSVTPIVVAVVNCSQNQLLQIGAYCVRSTRMWLMRRSISAALPLAFTRVLTHQRPAVSIHAERRADRAPFGRTPAWGDAATPHPATLGRVGRGWVAPTLWETVFACLTVSRGNAPLTPISVKRSTG